MNDRLRDILSNLRSEVDQEELLRYLEGDLAPERQQELEAKLLDAEFEAEALEGLQQLPDKTAISAIMEALNNDLKKKTEKRRSRRRGPLGFEPWLLAAIVILLLLLIIAFMIVWRHSRG